MKPKIEDLNIEKILTEFQEVENTRGHRKGTFKIDKSFNEALDTILKAKPESKASKKHQP